MPATQKIDIEKLGIIAGGGDLPFHLVSTCKDSGITPYIIGLKGHTDPNLMDSHDHIWLDLGAVGKVISFFKSNDVTDLVLIGKVKRPSFKEIKPDIKAVKILSRIGLRALGDNGLLELLKEELESEGFKLHGVHNFCDNLLVKEGCIGSLEPHKDDWDSINFGLKASQVNGSLDIGQSVIVQNGMIIGVEAVEGTDALMDRCKHLQQKGRGGILVKTRKPQQSKELDMPTIGVNTIENAHRAGLSGIVIHANNVMVVDTKKVANCADKYKIFVIAVNVDT
ncbi:MAG: LpxI family protein [Alphaproteobacteria bacterium]